MTPAVAREHAPAKINLCLHVVGRRADGYHLLDSLVVFTALGDTLEARVAPTTNLMITGEFARELLDDDTVDDDNSVMAAAGHLRRLASTQPVAHCQLTLEKNLPVSAGIGGGSADAAATLRLLNRLWNTGLTTDELRHIGLALGADVPVCIGSRAARMQGIGEIVTELAPSSLRLPRLDLVLVNPLRPVSTPAVFKRLENAENGAIPTAFEMAPGLEGFITWLARTRNDLQPAATALEPAIADVLAVLEAQQDCRLARMSGSGATCFGVFPDAAAAAHAERCIIRGHPDWWCKATRTIDRLVDLPK